MELPPRDKQVGLEVRDFKLLSKICLRCPEHALMRFATPRDTFSCDVCNTHQDTNSIMFGCRICNWDACAACCESMETAYAASGKGEEQRAREMREEIPNGLVKLALCRLVGANREEAGFALNPSVERALRLAWLPQTLVLLLCLPSCSPARRARSAFGRMIPRELVRMLVSFLGPATSLSIDVRKEDNEEDWDDDFWMLL